MEEAIKNLLEKAQQIPTRPLFEAGITACTKGAFDAIADHHGAQQAQAWMDAGRPMPSTDAEKEEFIRRLDANVHAFIIHLYRRHLSGDWGDICAEDKAVNDKALKDGRTTLLSSYNTPAGRLWVITDAYREATTVMLPEEY